MQRPAFRDDNTEGFTTDDRATLNAAHEALMAATNDADEFTSEQNWKNFSDMLNNAWFDGATVEQLVAAVTNNKVA